MNRSQQQLCLPHDAAMEHLTQRYSENVMGRGLTAGG